MQRSTIIGLSVGVLFLLIGLGLWIGGAFNGKPPDPDLLITQTLTDAKAAARRRDANGIMDAISDDFQGGGLNKQRLRFLVGRSLRQSRGTDYDVSVMRPRISEIKGKPDERLVISKFDVFYTDNGESIWGSNPIVMVMRKESTRKWLVFSEPKWRIVSIPNMPPLPGSDDVSDTPSIPLLNP